LGERVARTGVFISRSGTAEGALRRYSTKQDQAYDVEENEGWLAITVLAK
jgi:hypothetical protein